MAICKVTRTTTAANPPGITVVDASHPYADELLQAVVRDERHQAVVLLGREEEGTERDEGIDRDESGGGGAGGGGGGASGAQSGATAAAASGSSAALPSLHAAIIALVFFVIALVAATALLGDDGGPTFTAAEGIGAFALFYVVAQAAERLVEMTMPVAEKAVSLFNGTPKSKRVEERDLAVVDVVNAVDGSGAAGAQDEAETAAQKQADVDKARADRTLISFGATAALGMLLCAYLAADFLTSVGVDFTPGAGDAPGSGTRLVMMAVTGLVVGAGSKQLHDTISNISKSSEQKSTPAETGGQK
jgi:hypothetical protein